jgi:hypothetical protein
MSFKTCLPGYFFAHLSFILQFNLTQVLFISASFKEQEMLCLQSANSWHFQYSSRNTQKDGCGGQIVVSVACHDRYFVAFFLS